MKKWFSLLLFLPLLLSVSCGGDEQREYATVTVYNHSDFVVTDIVITYNGGRLFFSELQPGVEHTFKLSWEEAPAFNNTIHYSINGERFSTEHEEGAVWYEYKDEEGSHSTAYSPQYLKDGSKASVFIKNESYELIIEGGGYWKKPGPQGYNNVHIIH